MAKKEVYYHKYCNICKYRDYEENQDPCWDCLENPYNEDSHVPVYFKEGEPDEE